MIYRFLGSWKQTRQLYLTLPVSNVATGDKASYEIIKRKKCGESGGFTLPMNSKCIVLCGTLKKYAAIPKSKLAR